MTKHKNPKKKNVSLNLYFLLMNLFLIFSSFAGRAFVFVALLFGIKCIKAQKLMINNIFFYKRFNAIANASEKLF